MDETNLARPAPTPRVLLAGGGSGGHVFPALAVGEELVRRGWQVSFAGRAESMEERLASERGFQFVALAAKPLLGRGAAAQLRALATLVGSTVAARRMVRAEAFDGVLGTGGYVSAAAVLGGRWAGRPVMLLEPNATPGLANRWLSRIAQGAAVAFEATARELRCPCWTTGVPVRAAFFAASPVRPEGKPRLLVLGGSQGSQRLNRLLPPMLERLFAALPELSVLHQTGEAHFESTLAAYRGAGVETPRLRVVPFVDNVPGAMTAVDLVVSRAGAITLAEICAAGRPSLLLPLAIAAGHQESNAQLLADAGAARVLADAELDAASLGDALAALLADRVELARMGERARGLARPDAAAAIAERLGGLLEAAA